MPNGSELILGVAGKVAIEAVANDLECTVDWDNAELADADKFDSLLRRAHHHALTEAGLTVKPSSRPDNYVLVTGLDGVARQTAIWRLGLYFDPYEMDDGPEDAVLGVSLIRRYYPVFLDWMKTSGGSRDLVVLDSPTLSMIEIARTHISPILPFIKTAPIIVKELFY